MIINNRFKVVNIFAVFSLIILVTTCTDSKKSENVKGDIKVQSSTERNVETETTAPEPVTPSISVTPTLIEEKENANNVAVTKQQDKNIEQKNSISIKDNKLYKAIFSNDHIVVDDDFNYQHTMPGMQNYSPNYSEEYHIYEPSLKWSKSSSKKWSKHETQKNISVGPAEYGGTSYLELNQKYYTDFEEYIAIVVVEENVLSADFGVNEKIINVSYENKPQAGFYIGKSYVGGRMDQPTDSVTNMISCGIINEKAILTLIRNGNEVKLYKNDMLVKTISLKKEGKEPEEFGICNIGGPIRFSDFRFYRENSLEESLNYLQSGIKNEEGEKSARAIAYEEGKYFKDNLIGDELFKDDDNGSKMTKHIEMLEKYWVQVVGMSHGGMRLGAVDIPMYGGETALSEADHMGISKLQPGLTSNYNNYTIKMQFRRPTKNYLRPIGFIVDGYFIGIRPYGESDNGLLTSLFMATIDNVQADVFHELKLVRRRDVVELYCNEKKLLEQNFKNAVNYAGSNINHEIGIFRSFPLTYKNFELTID